MQRLQGHADNRSERIESLMWADLPGEDRTPALDHSQAKNGSDGTVCEVTPLEVDINQDLYVNNATSKFNVWLK